MSSDLDSFFSLLGDSKFSLSSGEYHSFFCFVSFLEGSPDWDVTGYVRFAPGHFQCNFKYKGDDSLDFEAVHKGGRTTVTADSPFFTGEDGPAMLTRQIMSYQTVVAREEQKEVVKETLINRKYNGKKQVYSHSLYSYFIHSNNWRLSLINDKYKLFRHERGVAFAIIRVDVKGGQEVVLHSLNSPYNCSTWKQEGFDPYHFERFLERSALGEDCFMGGLHVKSNYSTLLDVVCEQYLEGDERTQFRNIVRG